uniref:Uncharacterized protein n=1 Tax=Pristhesancus plagipennis TaxID=1955184 RepID=A0A2K8JX95_PRIPG|nr:secreted hypothetical protein [Pristhesancus plagipennis]
MQYSLLILAIAAGFSLSAYLPSGPDPVEWYNKEETQPREKQVSKRQVPWYLPVITVPQIVEVHHVVILQSPDQRCFPRRPPTPDTTPGPTDDGLSIRMGGGSNTTTATQPSKCVWAIVACCSPGSLNIRYTCFELLGCQGAFWDVNPCESRITMAAANTALKFYMSNTSAPSSNINDITSNLTQ